MDKWKWITGYVGVYKISDKGAVISIGRTIPVIDGNREYKKKLRERQLKGGIDSCGYMTYCLCKDGKRKTHRLHCLIYGSFVKKIEKGDCIDHIDENKLNNTVENLQCLTSMENLMKSGYGRKLTAAQAVDIREDKRSQRKIAKDYGVAHRVVQLIKKGATYATA